MINENKIFSFKSDTIRCFNNEMIQENRSDKLCVSLSSLIYLIRNSFEPIFKQKNRKKKKRKKLKCFNISNVQLQKIICSANLISQFMAGKLSKVC